MILVVVAEVIAWVLLGAFIAMQILTPAWRGVKLFPIFRQRAKLEEKLVELKEEEETAILEREVESQRKRVEAIKSLRSVQTSGSQKSKGE